ncbi:hypothetical protein E9549_03970 [Blastococcus sp. MG754426]|uniref:hypothetical protein n=1 Tax=unclassified Blastococcus TaxID=2619396 RepID=UPI001EF1140F|nr:MULTISPECIES: hypothetical protein [unclassified Blastococcus]MCF6506568.1 hypothetical protein [Blastococcus sp. MG754426]MCF6510278.1 hypothetical protein [Blastococcus sp. MG754427]
MKLPGDASALATEDIQALHDLADQAVEQLTALDVRPDKAVIGIYRQFNRSSRIAARILRTLLGPATCHTLTVASSSTGTAEAGGAAPGGVRPERLDLVVDVSRLPHPQARTIADAAGAPLITRAFPGMRQERPDRPQRTALEHGTATGRAIALNRSGLTARVTSVIARGAVAPQGR